jgi:uncharacterized membrane-anchored protein YhcB (DUF1043 family)
MRKSIPQVRRTALMIAILISLVSMASSQNIVTEMSEQGSLEQQIRFVESNTRIYENFRAIREDMFQKIKNNIIDSASVTKKKIADLNRLNYNISSSYDSLLLSLETTKVQLEEITETKESMGFLGFEVNKNIYNSIMWALIAGMLFLLLIGYLVFNKNRSTTTNTKKDLEDLKLEFEAYRKTSREAREKSDMAHFNEIQKLRGRS